MMFTPGCGCCFRCDCQYDGHDLIDIAGTLLVYIDGFPCPVVSPQSWANAENAPFSVAFCPLVFWGHPNSGGNDGHGNSGGVLPQGSEFVFSGNGCLANAFWTMFGYCGVGSPDDGFYLSGTPNSSSLALFAPDPSTPWVVREDSHTWDPFSVTFTVPASYVLNGAIGNITFVFTE